MDDGAAILETIKAQPDDDAPRLVYADWLEEHGNEDWAEFIRAQVACAYIQWWRPEYQIHFFRWNKLLTTTNRKAWVKAIYPERVIDPSFTRGFPSGFSLPVWNLLEYSQRIGTVFPIEQLVIFLESMRRLSRAILRQIHVPALRQMALGCDVEANEMRLLQDFLDGIDWRSVRRLQLTDMPTVEVLDTLMKSVLVSQIEALTMVGVANNSLITARLIGQTNLARLKSLDLHLSSGGEQALAAIGESTSLRLERFSLFQDSISQGAIAALCNSPVYANIKHLTINLNQELQSNDQLVLAEMNCLPTLESFTFSALNSANGWDEFRQLLQRCRLKHLDIATMNIDHVNLIQLMEIPQLRGLQHVAWPGSLDNQPLGPVFCDRDWPELVVLDASKNGVEFEVLMGMLENQMLPQLRLLIIPYRQWKKSQFDEFRQSYPYIDLDAQDS